MIGTGKCLNFWELHYFSCTVDKDGQVFLKQNKEVHPRFGSGEDGTEKFLFWFISGLIYIFIITVSANSILPTVSSTNDIVFQTPQTHSTPKTPSRSDQKKGLQDVIAKVERDTSIHMWKAAAEKVSQTKDTLRSHLYIKCTTE